MPAPRCCSCSSQPALRLRRHCLPVQAACRRLHPLAQQVPHHRRPQHRHGGDPVLWCPRWAGAAPCSSSASPHQACGAACSQGELPRLMLLQAGDVRSQADEQPGAVAGRISQVRCRCEARGCGCSSCCGCSKAIPDSLECYFPPTPAAHIPLQPRAASGG